MNELIDNIIDNNSFDIQYINVVKFIKQIKINYADVINKDISIEKIYLMILTLSIGQYIKKIYNKISSLQTFTDKQIINPVDIIKFMSAYNSLDNSLDSISFNKIKLFNDKKKQLIAFNDNIKNIGNISFISKLCDIALDVTELFCFDDDTNNFLILLEENNIQNKFNISLQEKLLSMLEYGKTGTYSELIGVSLLQYSKNNKVDILITNKYPFIKNGRQVIIYNSDLNDSYMTSMSNINKEINDIKLENENLFKKRSLFLNKIKRNEYIVHYKAEQYHALLAAKQSLQEKMLKRVSKEDSLNKKYMYYHTIKNDDTSDYRMIAIINEHNADINTTTIKNNKSILILCIDPIKIEDLGDGNKVLPDIENKMIQICDLTPFALSQLTDYKNNLSLKQLFDFKMNNYNKNSFSDSVMNRIEFFRTIKMKMIMESLSFSKEENVPIIEEENVELSNIDHILIWTLVNIYLTDKKNRNEIINHVNIIMNK